MCVTIWVYSVYQPSHLWYNILQSKTWTKFLLCPFQLYFSHMHWLWCSWELNTHVYSGAALTYPASPHLTTHNTPPTDPVLLPSPTLSCMFDKEAKLHHSLFIILQTGSKAKWQLATQLCCRLNQTLTNPNQTLLTTGVVEVNLFHNNNTGKVSTAKAIWYSFLKITLTLKYLSAFFGYFTHLKPIKSDLWANPNTRCILSHHSPSWKNMACLTCESSKKISLFS